MKKEDWEIPSNLQPDPSDYSFDLERALKAGYITQVQAKQFREQGAIGSHLENVERNEGFKGFNQTGVSEISAATDPRKQLHR